MGKSVAGVATRGKPATMLGKYSRLMNKDVFAQPGRTRVPQQKMLSHNREGHEFHSCRKSGHISAALAAEVSSCTMKEQFPQPVTASTSP